MIEPLDRPSAQLFARLLQGWAPRDLGLDRIAWVPDVEPKNTWKGMTSVPVHRTSMVWATLPGGSRPEVDIDRCENLLLDDQWDEDRGLAVFGFDEGQPVLLADITFSRSRVYWHLTYGRHEGDTWEFARHQYDAAIRDLLTLLGEAPVLIDGGEWSAPPATRVVPV